MLFLSPLRLYDPHLKKLAFNIEIVAIVYDDRKLTIFCTSKLLILMGLIVFILLNSTLELIFIQSVFSLLH